ncbi:hypothetical protein CIB84_013565 [Bambusicola thoracicus]|uniref:Uncharacterized protein n=1 Tax=Bambusicola thoracicus TaxID=9083 RepID=A0A2P4SEZ6_BAMTH|nr:hypothetical protein CIB84_013565 [Bambusicola thoracicus]
MQEVIQQLPAPHYRSENCCLQSGELSPAAFQRALMQWQALCHARGVMPVCVEVVAGSIRGVNGLGQFLGTGAWLVQLMAAAVLCWGLVLQRGTWSSLIYLLFRSKNKNWHVLRFVL